MLMMLARFQATGKEIPADAHDVGPVPGNGKKDIPADAHDAGPDPGNGKKRFQLMLMLAWIRAPGKGIPAVGARMLIMLVDKEIQIPATHVKACRQQSVGWRSRGKERVERERERERERVRGERVSYDEH